jgi:hypothetical protein
MDPEAPALELDDCHAHIGGHIAEAQRLLLLEEPYAAPVHLQQTNQTSSSFYTQAICWGNCRHRHYHNLQSTLTGGQEMHAVTSSIIIIMRQAGNMHLQRSCRDQWQLALVGLARSKQS